MFLKIVINFYNGFFKKRIKILLDFVIQLFVGFSYYQNYYNF